MAGGLGFTKQTENQLKQNRSLLRHKKNIKANGLNLSPKTKTQIELIKKQTIESKRVTNRLI